MEQSTKQMVRETNKGFTLLELLISLTILSVIVVIIFGGFRIGIRAWEKGERDVETRQRQRIVLDLIKRQIASICLREVKDASQQSMLLKGDDPSETKDANQQSVLLKGDDKSMVFLSLVPLVPGNRFGTVCVKYRVRPEDDGDRERLMFWEKNIVLMSKKTDMSALPEDEFFELLPGVQRISFEYLKGGTGEESSQWQQTWDQAMDEGLPRAVRVVMVEDVEKAPVSVIAPITPVDG